MPLPARRILYAVSAVALMAFLQLSVPIVCGAADREKALRRPADQSGCHMKLLKNRAYFHALTERIQGARKEIVMAFFLFKTSGHPGSYPEMLLRELGQAVRRGVRVTVVLEQDAKADSTVNRDNRNASERLKKAGVDVYFDSPKRTMHTKLVVIDGRYTFIGSHNMTQSALKHNQELSVMIDSPAVADMTMDYIRDLY